jgi:hypothetical protein
MTKYQDYNALIESVRAAFVEKVSSLKRVSILKFMKSKKTFPGVYLIYGPDGDLIYIGRTKSVRERISSHLSSRQRSGLLWYVCQTLSIRSSKVSGHKCACGVFNECRSGPDSLPRDPHLSEISKNIAKTYTVAFMRGYEESYHLENLFTHIMKPKHNFLQEEKFR